MEEKLRKGSFTLEDFLDQLQQIQKMGPLGQIVGMLPGMGGMAKEAQARSTGATSSGWRRSSAR